MCRCWRRGCAFTHAIVFVRIRLSPLDDECEIGLVQVHAGLLCAHRRMHYNRRTRDQPEISMKKIAIAFLAAATLASFGCKKKGGAGEAMEMMKKYKTDLCACKDHDLDCGKKATDAYQKAMTDWAAKNTGEKADPSAKPDPETEKLTTEVADCSKRVMTPDMGAADRKSVV